MLELSKLESNEFKLKRERVELQRVVPIVLALFRERAEKKGVRLVAELPAGAPRHRGRPARARARAVEPRRQRREVLPARGRASSSARRATTTGCAWSSSDTGPGIAAGAPAARLRALLSRRRGPLARARRDRPRPVDRQAHGRGDARQGLRRERGRGGLDVHRPASKSRLPGLVGARQRHHAFGLKSEGVGGSSLPRNAGRGRASRHEEFTVPARRFDGVSANLHTVVTPRMSYVHPRGCADGRVACALRAMMVLFVRSVAARRGAALGSGGAPRVTHVQAARRARTTTSRRTSSRSRGIDYPSLRDPVRRREPRRPGLRGRAALRRAASEARRARRRHRPGRRHQSEGRAARRPRARRDRRGLRHLRLERSRSTGISRVARRGARRPRVGMVTSLFAGTGERTLGAALENLQLCASTGAGPRRDERRQPPAAHGRQVDGGAAPRPGAPRWLPAGGGRPRRGPRPRYAVPRRGLSGASLLRDRREPQRHLLGAAHARATHALGQDAPLPSPLGVSTGADADARSRRATLALLSRLARRPGSCGASPASCRRRARSSRCAFSAVDALLGGSAARGAAVLSGRPLLGCGVREPPNRVARASVRRSARERHRPGPAAAHGANPGARLAA